MFDDINIFHINGTYKASYYFEKITSIYFQKASIMKWKGYVRNKWKYFLMLISGNIK